MATYVVCNNRRFREMNKMRNSQTMPLCSDRFMSRSAQIIALIIGGFLVFANLAIADEGMSRFAGTFKGQAQLINSDGTVEPRDLEVVIETAREGFVVNWTTITHKPDGRTKGAIYRVEFLPTDRETVFSAAMRRNIFGHSVPMDPMKGDPFVWAQVLGDTLRVHSLLIDNNGGYELQQYDRSLTSQGLHLEFQRFRNGEMLRSVSADLTRQ
jgi:hypothetical protein